MERILITGGSGFIGTNLVNYLLGKEYSVLSLDKKEPQETLKAKNFQCIDICDKSKLFSSIKEFDPHYIIHLAAKTGVDSLDPGDFKENYLSASLLCEVSNEVDSLKKIVFTSSLLVCRNGYIPISDNDFCPPNGYGHSKALSEIVIRDSNIETKWDIIRPTSIWGPWFSGGYLKFFELISKKLFFNISGEEILKPTCYVGNMVYMIEKIMKSNLSGGVYYLADYPQGSVQEWANQIHESYGYKGNIPRVPRMIFFILAKLGDLLGFIGINFPIYSSRLNNMLVSKEYPIKNTKEITGDLPFNSSEAIQETIKWMKARKK
tara:strand:+ start:17720 stop:18679 length:960 start_codon:yes stop_codon:yes gene_type:complete